MEPHDKVSLSEKGQSIELRKKADPEGPFQAILRWRASVDLDLHCFYQLKTIAHDTPSPGIFTEIPTAFTPASTSGHISFANKGHRDRAPWILLDADCGIGDVGGDNEENIFFYDIDKVDRALICANIYGKPDANFASYDSTVVVRGGGREFEVPLTESVAGSWCVVAQIDNSTGTPRLVNINRTQQDQPKLEDFC